MAVWLQMIVFYFCSRRITRSVVYGPKPRNRLDIYLPRNHLRDLCEPLPVVIFITGGRPPWLAAPRRLPRSCATTSA